MKKNYFSNVLIFLVSILWLSPIVTTLLVAFKTRKEYLNQQFYELPSTVAFFDNLINSLESYKIHLHILNSLFYSITAGSLSIILGAMAGYNLSRIKPKYSLHIFFIIYLGTVFPFQMYLIPLFKYYDFLDLYDTKLGMVLIYTALCIPFSLFVFRGYYNTIPRETEEAAKLDGCGIYKIFYYIFLPISGPPIAIVALFQMTFIWNDLLFGLVLSMSPDVRPVMVAVASMSGRSGGTMPWIMSTVILTSLPTIFLFFLLKKYFITGMQMLLK